MWNSGWDKIFKKYKWGKYPDLSLVRFLSKNLNLKNKRVLELGVGTGANLNFFIEKKLKVFGIDGSKVALKIANKNFKRKKKFIKLVQGDIIKLPYQNNFFDYIIDCECLYANSLKDTKKILSEVNRVLKKGGYFFSKTFAKNTVGNHFIRKNRKKKNLNVHFIKKGYGTFRISSLSEIKKIYSSNFKILNIELEIRTTNNMKDFIKEWVVISKKV